MTEVPRPAWLAELIEVARQLSEASGGDNAALPAERPERIGKASPDAEAGPGWFWLDLGGQVVESDQLETAVLGPAEGPQQRRFQVLESAQDGSVLRIKVASFAPSDGLFLWVSRRGRARLDKSLLAGLSQMSRFHLIDRFAQGRADPVPGAAPSGSLNADQARGLAACLAPGVQLVWGPPGTGKRLLAAALQELTVRGKNVLLVSGSNVAVDNALAQAATNLDPAPGVIVRVGTPHVTGVATDPRLCLQRMVLGRLQQLDSARAHVEELIADLRGHPGVVRLDSAKRELAGFDTSAYREARQHIDNRDWLAEQRTLMRQVQERAAASAAALSAGRARHDQAKRSWEECAVARQHLNAATALEMKLGNVAQGRDQAIADVVRLQADRERLVAESGARTGGITGLSRRRERKQLADLIADVNYRLDAAEARRREAERILATFSGQLTAQIEGHIHAAYPITDDEVAQRRIALISAEKQVRHAWDIQQECERQTQELDAQIALGERQHQPTAADLDLVARADEQDLPRKLFGLPELERQASQVLAEIERLEQRHEELVSQLAEEGRAVRREIIQQATVVATTLTMLHVTPEVNERDYDYVLVDEAASARLPEVVYAISRATDGATLLGDFLQNGPRVPAGFDDSRDPAIQRWLHQDCFALFGIHDRASAQASPGCVCLAEQYRFGAAINDLANTVAYEGLLQVAEGTAAAGASQEIVLVDVGGLGDELAAPRPSAGGSATWWPVGALISAALAGEHSQSSAKPVGVVTPYRCQAELIRSQLSHSGAPPKIEVGTTRAFQGRDFDTVIFDLAENGAGWVAQGRPGTDRHRLNGLRMFNVGVTLAHRRLYLIGSEALVRRSDGGPLHALRGMADQGRMRVVRAAEVLDLPAEPAGDPIASDVWKALRGLATLADLSDEHYLPEEVHRQIDQAAERIWGWSPWAGQRSAEFIPHLRAAADRGVHVHVVALSPGEADPQLRSRHEELGRLLPNVIFLHMDHQELIVVDRKLIFIGSVAVPAGTQGGRHEVMAALEGADIAERLLLHERADVLAHPPACPQCGNPVREAAVRGGDGRERLHWVCRAARDDRDCGWTNPFPDLPGSRDHAGQQPCWGSAQAGSDVTGTAG